MKFDFDVLGIPAFAVSADGKIIYWNDALETLTGFSQQEMLGKGEPWKAFYSQPTPTLADLLIKSPVSCSCQINAETQYDESGRFCSGLRTFSLAGRQSFWCQAVLVNDETGHPAYAVQSCFPISLNDSIEKSPLMNLLIERFPLPVIILKNYRFYLVNKAFSDMMGFDAPEELCGLPYDTFIDASDKKRFTELNSDNHSGLSCDQHYRWCWCSRSGKKFYLSGSPSKLSIGDSPFLLSVLTDETETVLRENYLIEKQKELSRQISSLLEQLQQRNEAFLGENPVMQTVLAKAVQAAQSDSNIVITGETGTGKSLLARLIHSISERRGGPFISINCGAIPENLMENEFFGHARGAFTGAVSNAQGVLGAANGGTLFLDEVGELSPSMQVKLLQALEAKTYTPIGSSKVHTSDIRLICATNRDLVEMLQEGSLRRDFFFRIFVVNLHLPPLRERREDIGHLARFFFQRYQGLDSKSALPNDVLNMMQKYDWPGNIRELQNVILRYLATGSLEILPLDPDNNKGEVNDFDIAKALQKTRRDYILRALKHTQGNKKKAAALLGMTLRNFQRYCAMMGLVRSLPKIEDV